MPAVRRLAPLVLGLTKDEAGQRWSLDRAQAFLADVMASPQVTASLADDDPWADDDSLAAPLTDRLLTDGLAHVARGMTPGARWLWRVGEYGGDTHPCAVQHGAAGVLGVLSVAARKLGTGELRDAVAAAARWIHDHVSAVPSTLPGLYFGMSGTAWSLYDAALLLGDEKLADGAVTLAKRLPATWPNPDICHGTAGAGLTFLHLWQATGDPYFERSVVEAADSILGVAEERGEGLLWRVPGDFDSSFAGCAYYGFAHGVAGIGCFLLYAGIATGRPDYLAAARRAGVTLAANAAFEGDAAWWPAQEHDSSGLVHWCNGSSGVGTFLIRLWSVTGESRFRTLAEMAGAAILRDRWYSSISACHGLVGDGEFLLDLADFTADEKYRSWASELTATMNVHNVIRDGLMLLPDESGRDVTAGYGAGLSGTLGFLLRMQHDVPRWWMPDAFLRDAVGTTARPLSHGAT
jgi:lantibiotic modifying enzyme